nr:cell division protein FtsA [uncultured Cellulosilyticum sp.]
MKDYVKETLCFGLDIGTRTVIGVVGYKDGNEFNIVAYERREHEERAMLDGQIHDIGKVAKTVYEVKSALEQKLDMKLTEVAIAAAGRALSTQIVDVVHDYEETQEFTLASVHHLELEGVERAKAAQKEVSGETDYFCVAYSVIHYYLDDYEMSNLEGHKGNRIGARLLATFLPKQVIDSLYAVTERAELTVSNLTLEPIAAINAVIPENIRLLNLALVDIGAGTSDIAITKEGSVVAYGMIPLAGDEVTEAIVHKYLVDFQTAEKMKQDMKNVDPILFNDILGLPQEISCKALEETIAPVLETLTKSIATKILELNGDHAPNAVFCVGGGSEMINVPERLAELLQLLNQRVATRSTEHLVRIKDEVGIPNSPDMITPLGICMTALENRYSEFTMVTLNGQQVQLLNAKKLSILDAIVAGGIEHTAIFPQRGKTLMFKLNGERMRIKGEKGTPATITLNGNLATINDLITEGDRIEVDFATAGEDGKAIIKDYIENPFSITINGQSYTMPLTLLNDEIVDVNTEIVENAELTILELTRLDEILKELHYTQPHQIVTVNLEVVAHDYMLQPNDNILIDEILNPTDEKAEEAIGTQVDGENQMDDCDEDETTVSLEQNIQVASSQSYIENLYIMANGKMVQLPAKESDYILANIFDFIDFDLSKPQGTVQLMRNGMPATLIDVLQNGDTLEIYWKK